MFNHPLLSVLFFLSENRDESQERETRRFLQGHLCGEAVPPKTVVTKEIREALQPAEGMEVLGSEI